MLLPRGFARLKTVCPSCKITARNLSGSTMIKNTVSETSLPKKRGPPKGRTRDPKDPSKFVSRASLIRFRPRGRTQKTSLEKTESDPSGKIVYEQVEVDINGIPEKIPKMYYKRFPLVKAEPGSYEDLKSRRVIPESLVAALENDIKKLKLKVDRLAWEQGLRNRPAVTSEAYDINKRIVDILRELRHRAIDARNPFKAHNYEMAIRSVESHHSPISSGKEMLQMPGIGPKTAEKIQEIIDTGTLRRLDDDTEDKKAAALSFFRRVVGIGPIAAQEFLDRGLLTLDDLRTQSDLTPQQKLGLQYFDELETKIPREEMDIWNTTIQTAVELVDDEYQATLVGPYRRGAAEAPDIDVLLTHPDTTDESIELDYIESITDKLQQTKHIIHNLTFEPNRYEGIARLPAAIFDGNSTPPPPHRRIKFRLVPWDSFVFAQLHFTGTEAFMRHLREQAARVGYRLFPEKLEKRTNTALEIFGVDGLRFMELDKNDTRKEGENVLLDSEEDVFRFLKTRYVHPHNRNWF